MKRVTFLKRLGFVLLFLCMTGMHAVSHAQDRTEIDLYLSDNATYTYGQTFSVESVIKFNPNACGPIHLEIEVPSSALETASPSMDAHYTSPRIASISAAGGPTRIISIVFDNLPDPETSTQWISTNIVLKGLRTLDFGCGDEDTIIGRIYTEDNNAGGTSTYCAMDEEAKPYVINRTQLLSGAVDLSHTTYFLNNNSPFYFEIYVYANNDRSLYDSLKLSVDLGTDALQCVRITSIDNRFQNQFLEFSQTGSVLTFRRTGAVDQRATYTFRVYCNIECDEEDETFSLQPEVTVTPVTACGAAGIPFDFEAPAPYTFDCIDDSGRLSEPYLFLTSSFVCKGRCNGQDLNLEINNLVSDSSYTDASIVFEFPEFVEVYNIWSNFQDPGLGVSAGTPYYQLCGETGWTEYLNGDGVPVNLAGRIRKFKVEYDTFDAGKMANVYFTYRAMDTDCNGNPVSYTSFSITATFLQGETVVGSKVLEPTFQNPIYCTPDINLYEFFYNSSTSNFQYYNNQFSQGQEVYARLTVHPRVVSNVNDYSFTYKLHPNMSFASNELKVYYGLNNYMEDPNGYLDIADARLEYADLSDIDYTINGDELTVTGIDLVTGCTGDQYIPAVLIKVKINNNAEAGNYNNFFTSCVNYMCYANNPTWTISNFFALYPDLYLTCDNVNTLTSADVRLDQAYQYNYTVRNVGSERLEDFILVATAPDVGDVRILSGQPRNSEFGTDFNCSFTVTGKEINALGQVVENNIPLDVDYKPTANVCPADFDVAGEPACSSWTTSCTGSPKAIRVKTSDYQLTPGNSLVITAEFHTPASGALGRKAYHTFAVSAASNYGGTYKRSQVLESSSTFITLAARSSCEPVTPECTECVPSFSPVPGNTYVLSAWVKEDFTGQYPATYSGSGVRIAFNEGTILLPVMYPAGPIIDGWQRIEREFTVPAEAFNIDIQLVNQHPDVDVYFDDIRIHPFQSNMKSFVYNPSTQKLTAELDENNYATLYEYDDEGILIRVKKETERGVMTIKETRMNQSKITGAP